MFFPDFKKFSKINQIIILLIFFLSLYESALAKGIKNMKFTNTAEQLGFSKNDRVLIIHADDIGMSHSVNRASFDAFSKGMITSGSVMLPTPWVPEVVEQLKSSSFDLGVHVTLTSEWRNYKWRPSSQGPFQGLVDSNGYLWPTLKDAIHHASSEEIEREVEAQVQRAIEMGLNPTHLDSHMGVHFAKPEFLKSVLKIAKKYKIPPILIRCTPELEQEIKRYSLPIEAIKKLTEEAQSQGFVVLDYLKTGVIGQNFEERKKSYEEFLRNLKPGVTQLIVHLGLLDEEMKGIMVGAPEGQYRRHADYLMFTDPNTKKLIDNLGIKLIGWKDLGKLAWSQK